MDTAGCTIHNGPVIVGGPGQSHTLAIICQLTFHHTCDQEGNIVVGGWKIIDFLERGQNLLQWKYNCVGYRVLEIE